MSLLADTEKELNRIMRISTRQHKKAAAQLDALLPLFLKTINSAKAILHTQYTSIYADLQQSLEKLKNKQEYQEELALIKAKIKERKLNYPYFKPFQSEMVVYMEQQLQEMVGNMVAAAQEGETEGSVNESMVDTEEGSLSRQQSQQSIRDKRGNRNKSINFTSSMTNIHAVTIDLVHEEPPRAHIDKEGKVVITNEKVKETLERLENMELEPVERVPALVFQPAKYSADQRFIYEGQVDSQNRRSGVGTLVNTCSGSIYTGHFEEDTPWGYGRLISAEGDYYLGETQNLMPQGRGECGQRENNRVVRGHFNEGLRQGWFTEQTGQTIITLYYEKGQVQNSHHMEVVYPDGGTYQGQHQDCVAHGQGRRDYANGDKYQGQFERGVRQGMGVYVFTDGSIYEGPFQEDAPHGEATYYHTDGLIYKGGFNRGRQHGKAIEVDRHTQTKRTGEWSDGRFIGWI